MTLGDTSALKSTGLNTGRLRLDGWKEIAAHLGRVRRTVQRWHVDGGLPVHHVFGPKGVVFAYCDELDDWLEAQRRPLAENGAPSAQSNSEPGDLSTGSATPCAVAKTRYEAGRHEPPDKIQRGNAIWQVLSDRNVGTMTRLFGEHLEFDPTNAQAFAGLAHSLIMQGILGQLGLTEVFTSAPAAAQAALELEPNLSDAKCALAWLQLLKEHDWAGSRARFDELASESPHSVRVLLGQGLSTLAEGSVDQAAIHFSRAVASKPLSSAVRGLCSWTAYLGRRYEAAEEQVLLARRTGRMGRILYTTEALTTIQRRDPGEAADHIRSLVESDPDNLVLHAALGHAFARTGDTGAAERILQFLSEPHIPAARFHAYGMAIVLTGLGEHSRAIEWLQQSYSAGSMWALGFPLDPILDPLRDDPAFTAFLQGSYRTWVPG